MALLNPINHILSDFIQLLNSDKDRPCNALDYIAEDVALPTLQIVDITDDLEGQLYKDGLYNSTVTFVVRSNQQGKQQSVEIINWAITKLFNAKRDDGFKKMRLLTLEPAGFNFGQELSAANELLQILTQSLRIHFTIKK